MIILKLKAVNWTFLVFCLSLNCFAQDLNTIDYFLRIKPLESNIEDVKKIYGIGNYYNDKYTTIYDTSFGTAGISYSTGDCKNGKIKIWNVPEWTVEKILYDIDDSSVKIKNLLKGIKPYKTRRAGDVLNHIEYYNEERGIFIVYDMEEDEVLNVAVEPTKTQVEKYSCEKIKEKGECKLKIASFTVAK